MTLSDAVNGQQVSVVGIQPSPKLNSADLIRLSDLGIVPGHKVRVVKRAPLGDPLQVELLGYQLCLRAEQACCIEVSPNEPVKKTDHS